MIAQKKNQRDFDYKMVIVTRTNLSLSAGKLAAQVSHAAVTCTLLTKKNKPEWFVKWQREGAKKVVVKVETLEEFYLLKEKRVKSTIFTHIPPEMEKQKKEIESQATKLGLENFVMAYDGLIVMI